MFKKHPKGLLGAAFANMGERFGFYTMMAILVLFLQTKFGLNGEEAGTIYSFFYAGIYFLSLFGGIIADKTKKFKTTIFAGLILMTLGYVLLAIPTPTPVPTDSYNLMLYLSCGALFIIAFGNGLFKGNLQALVGQMYDNEKYSKMRDEGFSIFYMFINVGAIFAPVIAVAVRNWWIQTNGYAYNQSLPDLSHSFLNSGGNEGAAKFAEVAQSVGYTGSDYTAFANEYLNIFTTGFHYAFGAAIVAMLISVVIFLVNKNKFPDPSQKSAATADKAEIEMSIKEVRQRVMALIAVFCVVIFFWFSFHQNGLTLTFFAKDYTDLSGINIDLGFTKLVGAELFQSINPFFVVFLTPIVLAVFASLRAKDKEPSTPKKIAIGMFIAALGFVLMSVGSLGLPTRAEAAATGYVPDVTPWLLVGTYFILTVAELFISPLGISFVSKVAPPKLQGLMQALWLCATAIGNLALVIGAIFYEKIALSGTWMIFVSVCLLSMVAMLVMLKWLERVSGK
ncbi:MAG: peptide MFS transporter [Rikenellaceae bacterium]